VKLRKALNPALSIRLNNDAAADLGIGATGRRDGPGCSPARRPIGSTGRQNYSQPQLPSRRQLASDLGNLYVSTNKRGPDGELRMVPLRQVADIVEHEPADHQAAGFAATRRALRQR
jgi:hypothetical protein